MSFVKAKILGVNIAPEVYHKPQENPRGTHEHKMSPSSIRAFGSCARKWRDGFELEDSDAKDWGNLIDTLVLTPQFFKDRYAVHPDTYYDEKSGEDKKWNWNSKVCKEWRDEHEDMEHLSKEDHLEASNAVVKLRDDPAIANFLDVSEKQVMVEGFWQDKQTGLTIPVRCLIDLVPKGDSEYGNAAGDLKTTRNAALSPFQRDTFKNGYHIQAAFDLDLLNAATGQTRKEWRLVLLENVPPFQTGKRLMTDNEQDSANFIELGRHMYRRLLNNYCVCLATGVWPSYDDHDEAIEGWSPLRADSWMADSAMFAPKFQLPETAEEPIELTPGN